MSNDKKPVTLPADNPIQYPESDVLGRTEAAKKFARHVLTLDASEGVAVGVFGPWGSGKTSFVNLARTEFEREKIPVLDFNPWMFSGAEQLVERFFAELSANMGKTDDLNKIGQALRKYGDAFNTMTSIASKLLGMPQVGEIVTTILKTAVNTADQPAIVADLRREVECELQKRDKPIIVVLDDIDRLSVSEIRDIFKLVRLTASFPNLIYIVVCDRLQVEQALDDQGLTGRDYLEKIIQLPFDLPEVPRHLLRKQTFAEIERALANIENPGPFDQRVWSYVYREIIQPLIRNMRDVRRYAIAIRETLAALEGRVAQADVLGLEAVRVFLPDVFRRLPGAIDALTVTSTSRSMERDLDSQEIARQLSSPTNPDPWLQKQIDELSQAGKTPEQKGVVQAMIHHLFPPGLRSPGDITNDDEWAGRLLLERRVAHENILRLYLERVVDSDLLAFYDAERAFERMTDRHGLDEFIRSLDPALWPDVIEHLESFEGRFRLEHVEPGIVVLLNLLPDMPERSSISDFLLEDPIITVERVASRLLRSLNGAEAVESAVRGILPQVTSLSSKVALVLLVGHRDEVGDKLVSEPAAAEFERTLRGEIRSASPDNLAAEHDLGRILNFDKNTVDSWEGSLDGGDSPRLTFAILRSGATTETDPRLDWVGLIDYYGGEETLKARIENLNTQFEDLKPWIESLPMPLDDAESLLDLACRYRDGQRPERRRGQGS